MNDATFTALLATFFEESFEGLDRAEAGLLQLDTAGSPEIIGDLFRAIHSIKGGSGAFGIDEVTGLAHVMENLLDDIRSGRACTAEMSAALLSGVDHLRRSLDARQARRPVDTAGHAPVIARIVAARGAPSAPGAPKPAPAPVAAPAAPAAETWRIRFAPHAHLMRSGNDPVRILDHLASFGASVETVDRSKLPPLGELDPTACYLAWELRVPGTVARADLDDAFAWVEGECDLVIERDADIVVEVEEASPVSAPAALAPAAAGPPAPAVERREGISTLRVGVDKIDLLMNMVGELVITQSMLGELEDDRPLDADRVARLREGLGLLARTTRALQESVVRLRSTPVSTVFARLPRIVHDVGRRLGKDIAITISGESTELDRTVLEKLGDPLVHLVRNSIDHGIEDAETRLAAGKPAQGTISLHAEHRGSAVVIGISDDGRGLDLPKILAKAKAKGLVAADAELTPDEIAALIFAPGFSTAEVVSEVSGRGVGMDVVMRHIKELRGEVSVTSEPGKGTRTLLSLPLTLAIIDGQLVRLADQAYVVPLLAIRETVELRQFKQRRFGTHAVIRLRDEIVPVVDLGALLGIEGDHAGDDRLLMIVEAEGQPMGLIVDELLAQQQVVIKSLETNFGKVDGLAGATILGDGRVAFILDIAALHRDVRRQGRSASPDAGTDQAA